MKPLTIKGLEHFSISPQGDVYNTLKGVYVPIQIETEKYGHHAVMLYNTVLKKQQYLKVHRLVLLAYAGNPPDDSYYGCHRDGNPANNSVDNLYWGTPQQNTQDALNQGTLKGLVGASNGNARLTEEMVIKAKKLRQEGMPFYKIAELLDVGKCTIRNAIVGNTWKHIS